MFKKKLKEVTEYNPINHDEIITSFYGREVSF